MKVRSVYFIIKKNRTIWMKLKEILLKIAIKMLALISKDEYLSYGKQIKMMRISQLRNINQLRKKERKN